MNVVLKWCICMLVAVVDLSIVIIVIIIIIIIIIIMWYLSFFLFFGEEYPSIAGLSVW